jgi:hypothetical protein
MEKVQFPSKLLAAYKKWGIKLDFLLHHTSTLLEKEFKWINN